MDYKFWVPLAVTIYGVYLTQKQVSLMNPPDKNPVGFSARAKRHWPLFTMMLMVILVWIPYLYAHYSALSSEPPTATDIPEFDQNKELVLHYGMDTINSCTESVNGDLLLERQPGYKLAVACFVYDGKEDILDAPYIQVSDLYDIRHGTITMQAAFKPYFVTYMKNFGANGMNFMLLNVPNGVNVSEFKTLHEARAAGVKMPHIDSASTKLVPTQQVPK